MSQSSQPQATVITGPQGSSDVPVPHPGTAPARSIPPQPSNPVGSVPSQQTPPSGSVPSQHTSSGGSVPSQQVPPARSVPPQQTSLSETGSEEDDFPLPPPLLPLPMDPGLREVLDRQAEPFTLPEDQSSSVPPTERILEDPRIQTVLNGIYQWAIKNRIPTESLFGDHISSPRHFGTPLLKRDIYSVKHNLPPAIPRPSGPAANLQRFGFDQEESPRSPQLNSDYLVSSLLIPPRVPASIPRATDSTTAAARPFPLPKVRSLGSSAKAVPDPGDYLPFMKEFSIWSREANGSSPFVPTLPAGYNNPQLDLDISRAYLLGVNPRGVLQFIYSGLIDIWKSSKYIDPVKWTENDIWLCIVLHSQYPDANAAEQALEFTVMDWSIHDPQSRWYDFLNRFQDVLARLTLAGVLYGRPAAEVRTSRSFVKQTFLANVGILRLFVDLYPSIFTGLITSFIPIVGREHRTWCDGKSYHQQCQNRLIDPIIDPDSGQWQSVPPRLQKAARAAQLKLTRVPPSHAPQVRHPRPQKPSPSASWKEDSDSRESPTPPIECRYCHSLDHVVDDCPDPDCRQSKYFRGKGRKAGRRGKGGKDSKRGAPPNKKQHKYDVSFCPKVHRFIPQHTSTSGFHTEHSGSLPSSLPSNNTSSDDVVRYVASSPVPLREGSRRAGRRKDINDSKLFGWAEFDDKLAHVFGHGTNPDALSRNLGIPDSLHNVSIPDSASTCHPFGIPDSYYDSSGHHLVQGDGYNDVDLHSIDYIDHTILSLDPAQPIKKPQLIKLNILINDVPVTGVIDTAASCSVISKDLASSSHMKILPDSIRYVSANNVTSSSLGTAQGVLSFRLGSIANLVRLNHRLPIIPGSDLLLIGIDILSQLGLLNEDGLSLRLDKEHSVILLSEAEFDDRILMADESSRPAKITPLRPN
ncbi:hypothetical protein RCL1_001634 [Eukaryota sp. TZLM3-RCL]